MLRIRSTLALAGAGVLAAAVAGVAAARDGAGARAAAAIAAVIAATTALWALHRAGHRVPVWLAQRRGGSPDWTAARSRRLRLVLLAPEVAVVVGCAATLSALFPGLDDARRMAGDLVSRSFSATLFRVGERGYTAVDVLALPALLAGLWLGVHGMTRLLGAHVLRPAGADRGVQETVVVFVRYALFFVGGLVVLQAWGIDVASLAIVLSVLGVGLGFGLQNIANNFVSGVLMRLERPMKIGDFVQVAGFMGTVERIGARSTEIRTLDRVSIVLPNSAFLEREVVNWSLGDPVSRLHVPVGVAYGSDVQRVRQALLEAARSHPCVLADPPAQVQLVRFGESSLDFELLVWTRDPRTQFTLRSDLNYRIDANLRRHGLQIPFPQRDLHLRSPELDALVAALARPHAAASPVPSPPPAPTPRRTNGEPAPIALGRIHAELAPRAWSDAALAGLAVAMRGAGGVEVMDRRHLFTVYPRCFVGRDAVDWLVRHEGLSRADAVRVGRRLVERGLVRHVLDEHGFEDGRLFYRFADHADAERGALDGSERSAVRQTSA